MSEQSIVINLSAARPPNSSQPLNNQAKVKQESNLDEENQRLCDTHKSSNDGLAAGDSDLLSYWSDSVNSTCDANSLSPTPSQQNACSTRGDVKTRISNTSPSSSTSSSFNSQSLKPKRCNTTNRSGIRKRVMANERERERTKSLNQALEILRNRLPVTEPEKRSKIQTLRVAKEYIEFLARVTLSQPPQHSTSLDDQPELHTVSGSEHFQSKTLHNGQATTQSNQQPDSPLTYKFYKFRLMNRND